MIHQQIYNFLTTNEFYNNYFQGEIYLSAYPQMTISQPRILIYKLNGFQPVNESNTNDLSSWLFELQLSILDKDQTQLLTNTWNFIENIYKIQSYRDENWMLMNPELTIYADDHNQTVGMWITHLGFNISGQKLT